MSAMDRARGVIAEALNHIPVQSAEGHWACLGCDWEDSDRELGANGQGRHKAHFADAILAALVEELGLREFVAYLAGPPMRKTSWLETKPMEEA